MPAVEKSDALVVGGGVIGLSIAYELAREGLSTTVLERGLPGREASWAGAGILPPASWYVDDSDVERLCLAAAKDHAEWSERLRELTGLDDEYWLCGAEYRQTPQNSEYVDGVLRRWRSLGVECTADGVVLGEAQVRNPRRLKALLAACQRSGVRVEANAAVTEVRQLSHDSIEGLHAAGRWYAAGQYVLAAGCWTPALAGGARSAAPGRPVRGQMLLLKPRRHALERIVHLYPYYAVPRRDGRVLVGATVEEVGFEKQTTESAYRELHAVAASIEPGLADAEVEAHWAGLRPASQDSLPLIGRLPGVSNGWVATGHHRSGLQLAPPTAEIIAALVQGRCSPYPIERFDPARFAAERVVA